MRWQTIQLDKYQAQLERYDLQLYRVQHLNKQHLNHVYIWQVPSMVERVDTSNSLISYMLYFAYRFTHLTIRSSIGLYILLAYYSHFL